MEKNFYNGIESLIGKSYSHVAEEVKLYNIIAK